MRFYATNIDDRKRHEESLRHNENLSAKDQGLRVANESTLEHASKLEDIVDERTVKLSESDETLRGFMDSAPDNFWIY
ncbi:MAG: hypothetical protein ABSA11_06645 [Candidatus Bathyarchaeia archaeon]